ncbi:MAG: DGQHR domain-containing protein [Pseudomonadota bacterium]
MAGADAQPSGSLQPKRKQARKRKAKKPRLSAAEKKAKKIQSDHKRLVRSIFRYAGFNKVSGVADKEFEFLGQKGDIDDVFVFENVVVLAEYTSTKSSNVGSHLKPKKILFDKITADPVGFIDLLKTRFPSSAHQFPENYHHSQLVIRILYCSRYELEEHYKKNVPGPVYMDYPAVRYFAAVADAVRMSSRFELFDFLGIEPSEIGKAGKVSVSDGSRDCPGLLLPEAHSHFDDGFKVVSFFAEPESLLKTTYVLRKDGWKDSSNLYQRMISKGKIAAIRSYLKTEKRVFINNIIVTLPPEVRPIDEDGNTVNPSSLIRTEPVTIKLPEKPNTVGIIDGQHRVFAYHESVEDDPDIAALRGQQNLLVTGVIYPEGLSPLEKEKFEARLFLEINSTQTNAKSQLKQAIGLVLDPFSTESIATRVLSGLAKNGPLAGVVERYFFDTDKLKTSSIVSYGLKPLVKPSGADSLFSVWSHANKNDVAEGKNDQALADYVEFCVLRINRVLASVKKHLSAERWTTDPKVSGRILATTYVNSFLIVMRILIERGHSLSSTELDRGFAQIDQFDFSPYHSSQYNRMAQKIVEEYF